MTLTEGILCFVFKTSIFIAIISLLWIILAQIIITVSHWNAWKHCEDHVLWFLQSFQHRTACISEGQAELTGVDQHLTSWILNYLTNQPRYVRTQGCVSDTVICSTGPYRKQSWLLSFSPYTQQTSPTNHPTAIYKKYRLPHQGLTQDFVDWCKWNHHPLNAGKTKELVVDFHRHIQPCTQVNTKMVTSYKYLWVQPNNKLDWTDHTAAIYKNSQSRLYLLRKLRSWRGHFWGLSMTLWWHQPFSM